MCVWVGGWVGGGVKVLSIMGLVVAIEHSHPPSHNIGKKKSETRNHKTQRHNATSNNLYRTKKKEARKHNTPRQPQTTSGISMLGGGLRSGHAGAVCAMGRSRSAVHEAGCTKPRARSRREAVYEKARRCTTQGREGFIFIKNNPPQLWLSSTIH